MVIFSAPYIMPVTMTNKEIHAMDKLIHDGVLTEKGKQELIQIIKIVCKILNGKSPVDIQNESYFFDDINIIPSKNLLTKRIVLNKNLFQVDLINYNQQTYVWNNSFISFKLQNSIKTSFNKKDFDELNLKLLKIKFNNKDEYNDEDYYSYEYLFQEYKNIKIIFDVKEKLFNKTAVFPDNFSFISIKKE